ncbi:MAG: hypothetical protein M9924_11670 [Rhizobiaceae bacterium]|nr:hypothetical protein [Rhizobiaceae bacterium]
MTLASKSISMSIAALSFAALAGCSTGGGGSPTRMAAASPVDGEWLSTDGVAVSRFQGGIFSTTATDTGNKLAEGTYRFSENRMISISGTSLIRQTPIAFNCLLATPQQLNCTNATGQNFSLNRRQPTA